jgi:hypothetical protein
MRIGRLRTGELVALAGAVGLLVTLFFDWFGVDLPAGRHVLGSVHQSGWAGLGWFLDILLCIQIFGGLAITYMTLKRSTPAWPVGAAVLSVSAGGLIFLILLVRVLTQPGLGADLPNALVSVELPAYLGLLFSALIPAGAWIVLRDERLDAPESAYTPPPARPVPGT